MLTTATGETIPIITNDDFFQYWKKNISTDLGKSVNPLELFKERIQQFNDYSTGTHYWHIFSNNDTKVLDCGGAVEQLVPYTAKELVGEDGASYFLKTIYPNHIPQVMSFVQYFSSIYMQLKRDEQHNLRITIYLKAKNRIDEYNWVSVQYTDFIMDGNNKILFGLVFYTNVNHILKKDTQPFLTIFNKEENELKRFYCSLEQSGSPVVFEYPELTKRQENVLELMLTGKPSKLIADDLHIAKSTVENYRQSILKKFDVPSTAELLSKLLSKE